MLLLSKRPLDLLALNRHLIRVVRQPPQPQVTLLSGQLRLLREGRVVLTLRFRELLPELATRLGNLLLLQCQRLALLASAPCTCWRWIAILSASCVIPC